MYELLSIILIVFGILQIILFFKMWGMTNNVEKITAKLKCENDDKSIKKAILLGDKELARDLLTEKLVDELFARAGYVGVDIENTNTLFSKYKVLFEKIGYEIPENILKIKKYSELKDLL